MVANWADAVLAMIELLPASGKLAQGKLRFLGRKFRPETVVGMVRFHSLEDAVVFCESNFHVMLIIQQL